MKKLLFGSLLRVALLIALSVWVIFTVHKRSCGKVMFVHLSVSNSVHRGVVCPVHAGIHPPGQTPPHHSPKHTPLRSTSMEPHPISQAHTPRSTPGTTPSSPWKHTHPHPLEAHPPPRSTPARSTPPRSTHPPRSPRPKHTPQKHPPPDGHCSGRYTSYWNTFLFIIVFRFASLIHTKVGAFPCS